MKNQLRSKLWSPSVKKQIPSLLLLASAGLGAGLLCGLLGAGGGIVLLFALQRMGKREELRDAFASSLAIMIPLALVACWRYSSYGSLSGEELSPFLLPAILGGLFGGFLLGRIQLFWLRILFAALMVISGILLLVRS